MSKYTESQQKNLDKLCDRYGVSKFTLGKDEPKWEELVMKMITKKAKKIGRPKREDDRIYQIVNYIKCIVMFSESDEKKMSVKEAIYKAIDEFGIKEKIYANGRVSTPFEITKGILYRNFPEVVEKMRKEQEDEDWE